MSSNHKLYAYLRDEFLPLDSAYLHVSDLAIQRGYGIFDFFKVQHGQPLFLDDYLNRFYSSALLMGLPVPYSEEELKEFLFKLIQMNGLPDAGVKMILTGGYSENGYDPGEPNLLLFQQPLTMPSEAQVATGIKVITHEYVRELAVAKTINYIVGIKLIQQVKAKGAHDVLYHHQGMVTEFPRSNFFLVTQDNTLVTPAREVLKGVTRKNVLELAGKKYNVQETDVTLQDIAQAKEAFMTSTTKRILPIVEVDGQPVGDGKPGAVTLDLLQDLIELENKQL
ncbi:MAG: aminotransferase class IV [Rufibacter sp.]